MRSYCVNNLYLAHINRLVRYLQDKGLASALDGLFWIELPVVLLTDRQREHWEECSPYYLSLEVGKSHLELELFVRTRQRLRCACIAYATPLQREYAINWLDALLQNLDITV